MKRFLALLALAASLTVAACESGTPSSGWLLPAIRIPYISHINGLSVVEKTTTRANGDTDKIWTLYPATVSTNGPFTFRVAIYDLLAFPEVYNFDAAQNSTGLYGITIVTYSGNSADANYDLLEPAITFELAYSTDRTSWTVLSKRHIANALNPASLSGAIFQGIALPVTLRSGTTVYFRLAAYPLGASAAVNYNINWDTAAGTWQQVYTSNYGGAPNPGSGSVTTEARVVISGAIRPGRSK